MDNSETPTRPVMDIRPQRSAPQPVQRSSITAAADRPAPANEEPSVSPVMPAPEPDNPEPSPEASNDAAVTMPPASDVKLPPKHKAPVLAVIVAVLVAGTLIGLTVFTYLKSQKEPTAQPNNQETQSATPVDVDSSIEDVEGDLNTVNDGTDFNSADLSDEALGL